MTKVKGSHAFSFLFSVIFLICSLPVPANATTYLLGRVVAIADGDTITVVDSEQIQHKIRLTGIDAPEKKQAFGEVSRQNIARLVFGADVLVEIRKRDRYQRELGRVVVGGMDVNLTQIQSGMAWHYKKYEMEQPFAERQAYSDAEQIARAARVGLWNDSSPIPPWEFRHPVK